MEVDLENEFIVEVSLDHYYLNHLNLFTLLPLTFHFSFLRFLSYEYIFMFQFPDIVEGIKRIGHEVVITETSKGFAAATAISNVCQDTVTGVYDKRRPGSVAYMQEKTFILASTLGKPNY